MSEQSNLEQLLALADWIAWWADNQDKSVARNDPALNGQIRLLRNGTALIRALSAQPEQAPYREIIMWALGERDEFPDRPADWHSHILKPYYWWRKEMRARLAAADAQPQQAKDMGAVVGGANPLQTPIEGGGTLGSGGIREGFDSPCVHHQAQDAAQQWADTTEAPLNIPKMPDDWSDDQKSAFRDGYTCGHFAASLAHMPLRGAQPVGDERQPTFMQLADALPSETHWSDPLTPDIARSIWCAALAQRGQGDQHGK